VFQALKRRLDARAAANLDPAIDSLLREATRLIARRAELRRRA
jgi:hypothetical protein